MQVPQEEENYREPDIRTDRGKQIEVRDNDSLEWEEETLRGLREDEEYPWYTDNNRYRFARIKKD